MFVVVLKKKACGMNASNVIGAILVFVFLTICCNYALRSLIDAVSRKKIAIAVGSEAHDSKLEKFVLINTKIFGELAHRLLNIPFVSKGSENIVLLTSMRGVRVNRCQVVSCILGLAFVCAFVGFIFTTSPVFGLSFAICLIVGILSFSGSRLSKATNDMREQVPDAIQCMANCSASGFSLMQTFEQAEKECGGALGKTFSLAHKRLKLGSSVDEALDVFENVNSIPELKFISIAFRMQHVAGGPISEVLECARESVLSELELARTLRIQTTQAKMSASIVTLMPFVLLALFSFLSPGFLQPFFTSVIGVAIFCLAFFMQATGVFLVRKTLARCED